MRPRGHRPPYGLDPAHGNALAGPANLAAIPGHEVAWKLRNT